MAIALLMGCGVSSPQNNPDAGAVDADASAMDTVSIDAGTPGDVTAGDVQGTSDLLDAGGLDVEVVDAGPVDVVDLDAGAADEGSMDVSPTDGETPDTVAPVDGPADAGSRDDAVDVFAADAPSADTVDAYVMGDAASVGCAQSLATITLPGTVAPIAGTTRGASTIPTTGCYRTASGPENVYTLNVTSTSWIVLDTRDVATNLNTLLSVRRVCADVTTEVACNATVYEDIHESSFGSLVRVRLTPGSYSVIVDSYTRTSGNYVLRASTYEPLANALCTGALALTADAPLTAQNLTLAASGSSNCSIVSGGELFYTFTLPPNSQATLRASPTDDDPTWGPLLRAFDGCSAATCLASATGDDGSSATVRLSNPTAAARAYTLSVSGAAAYNTAGNFQRFQLSADVMSVVPTSVCPAAAALVNGAAAVTGNTTLGLARPTRCVTTDPSNEVYYAVSIPAGLRVTVRAQPQVGNTWRLRLRSVATCAATACLGESVATSNGGEASLVIDNPSESVVTALVTVASTTAPGGTFTIAASLAGAGDAGTGDAGPTDTGPMDTGPVDTGAIDTGPTDAGPTDTGPMDAGSPDVSTADVQDVPFTGDGASVGCALPLATISLPGTVAPISGTTRGVSTIPAASCQSNATGPENVYALTMTSTAWVRLDVDDVSTNLNTVLSIRRTCADVGTEVACNALPQEGGSGAVARARLAPGSYSVIVDGASGAAGNYVLRARTYEPALNAQCSGATTLNAGTPLTAQSLDRAGGPSAACSTATSGELFYALTLPAGSRATLRALPTGRTRTWRPVLRVLDSCAAATCLANATGDFVTGATLDLSNTDAAPRTYAVSVSAAAGDFTEGTFQISATTTLPSGSVCSTAIALVNGDPAITGDTTLGAARSARCDMTDLGNEVYYAVSIPPGRRVTVRAQPQAGNTWRPRLRAISSCDSIGCRSDAVATADGGEATLALDNPSQSPGTVLVSVASTTALGGPFAIAATSAALTTAPVPHYLLSSIAGACDDVSAGGAVAPADDWDDDASTAVLALPWTFRFFRTNATHYSVASNGFAQLWTSASGDPSFSFGNDLIPDADNDPNNFVAPFADDLAPTGPETGVRVLSLGASPSRRFVIQWTNWQFFGDEPSSTDLLTFQVKLYETSGVIEFHYCALGEATERDTGAQAVVGLENAAGTLGNLVLFQSPGGLSPGAAFRLTPPGTP